VATWVVDASVVLKWLLADPGREPDTAQATALMDSIASGHHAILQPVHWLAEVAAVLARLSPETAAEDIARLRAMDWPVADDVQVWTRACRLSIETRQHVFDTLYHAVALEHADATLVTADGRYQTAVRGQNRIISVGQWTAG